MAAVPKTRTSRARRDSRRAQSFTLKLPGIAECPRCHEMKRTHCVCPSCGYYDGRAVVQVEKAK